MNIYLILYVIGCVITFGFLLYEFIRYKIDVSIFDIIGAILYILFWPLVLISLTFFKLIGNILINIIEKLDNIKLYKFDK